LASAVVCCAAYVSAPAVAVITNATKIVKGCKIVYTGIGYVLEVVEDASNLTFLPIDMLIFGQPIPSNESGRYSSWDEMADLISKLPVIGDAD